jgi:hypothetical protein
MAEDDQDIVSYPNESQLHRRQWVHINGLIVIPPYEYQDIYAFGDDLPNEMDQDVKPMIHSEQEQKPPVTDNASNGFNSVRPGRCWSVRLSTPLTVSSYQQPIKQEQSSTPTGPSNNNSASYGSQSNLPANPMTGMQTGYDQYTGGGGGGYAANSSKYGAGGNFPSSSGMDALMLADLNWVRA